MEDSASSLRPFVTKKNKEISLDYDSLAKIQKLQLVLGSEAFALGLLTCSADSSSPAVLSAILKFACTNPHSVNVTCESLPCGTENWGLCAADHCDWQMTPYLPNKMFSAKSTQYISIKA